MADPTRNRVLWSINRELADMLRKEAEREGRSPGRQMDVVLAERYARQEHEAQQRQRQPEPAAA